MLRFERRLAGLPCFEFWCGPKSDMEMHTMIPWNESRCFLRLALLIIIGIYACIYEVVAARYCL